MTTAIPTETAGQAVAAAAEGGAATAAARGRVTFDSHVDVARTDVGMPGELGWSWYQLWADRGLWDNRHAVMSDAAVSSYDSISAAARPTRPLLMVHSDQYAVPDAARRHCAVVPTADKYLLWEGQTRHLRYYDDPTVIDRTVCSIVDWIARHLGPGQQSMHTSSAAGSVEAAVR